jgi:hypothetical protein
MFLPPPHEPARAAGGSARIAPMLRRLLLPLALAACGSPVHGPHADLGAPGDGAMIADAPPGTQLASDAVTLYFVDDTRAVYGTLDGRVYEVALAGGAPVTIAGHSDLTRAFDADHVATWEITYAPPPPNSYALSGILTLWRSDTGSHTLALHSFAYEGALSSDGSLAAYQDNMSADGLFADVYLARSDGSAAPVLLMSRVSTGAELVFAGERLVVLHGATGATFDAWDLAVADATGNVIALDSGVAGSDPLAVSSDGTRVIGYLSAEHKLRSWAVDGSGAVDLDSPMSVRQNPSRSNQPVAYPSGADLVYFGDGLVRKVPAAGGAVTVLSTTLAESILALSSDGSRVAWTASNMRTGAQWLSVSTIADGRDLVTISGDGSSPFGLGGPASNLDPFSADGSAILYFDPDLNLCEIASGKSTRLSTATSQGAIPVSATRAVSLDVRVIAEPTDAGPGMTTSDLVLYDAGGAPPLRLATDVGSWGVTRDRTRVVYAVTRGARVGLFVSSLPAP